MHVTTAPVFVDILVLLATGGQAFLPVHCGQTRMSVLLTFNKLFFCTPSASLGRCRVLLLITQLYRLVEVLLRLGASRVLKNFRHVITATPPRWKITDGTGVLVRVSPWIMVPGNQKTGYGKGFVAIPNPEYLLFSDPD